MVNEKYICLIHSFSRSSAKNCFLLMIHSCSRSFAKYFVLLMKENILIKTKMQKKLAVEPTTIATGAASVAATAKIKKSCQLSDASALAVAFGADGFGFFGAMQDSISIAAMYLFVCSQYVLSL